MCKNIENAIEELKINLIKVYQDWKEKNDFSKYDNQHFLLYYADGEYEPFFEDVVDRLVGYVDDEKY